MGELIIMRPGKCPRCLNEETIPMDDAPHITEIGAEQRWACPRCGCAWVDYHVIVNQVSYR